MTTSKQSSIRFFDPLQITLVMLAVLSLILSGCAQVVPSNTPTPTNTSKPTSTFTSTPRPTRTPLPTSTPNLQATQQYTDILKYVNDLYDQGLVSSVDGTYIRIPDFDQSFAQLNWYQGWFTKLEPENFVLRSHIEWESASNTADWYVSGCGFLFHTQDMNNHYAVFFAMDGYVRLFAQKSGVFTKFAENYFGKVDFMKDNVDFTLIVDGNRIRVLINEKQVTNVEGFKGSLREGELAFTLISGTNKGFGTRCSFTNNELWDFSNSTSGSSG